jgi:hypothetical protein
LEGSAAEAAAEDLSAAAPVVESGAFEADLEAFAGALGALTSSVVSSSGVVSAAALGSDSGLASRLGPIIPTGAIPTAVLTSGPVIDVHTNHENLRVRVQIPHASNALAVHSTCADRIQ